MTQLEKIYRIARFGKIEDADTMSCVDNDVFRHPALMKMTERELADLPFCRPQTQKRPAAGL